MYLFLRTSLGRSLGSMCFFSRSIRISRPRSFIALETLAYSTLSSFVSYLEDIVHVLEAVEGPGTIGVSAVLIVVVGTMFPAVETWIEGADVVRMHEVDKLETDCPKVDVEVVFINVVIDNDAVDVCGIADDELVVDIFIIVPVVFAFNEEICLAPYNRVEYALQ